MLDPTSPTDPEGPEESLWIERAQLGDRSAIERLVGRYREKVRRVALDVLRDGDAADEIMVEVLARLPESIRSYKGDARFSTWLHQVTRNRAVSELRRRREPAEAFVEEIPGAGDARNGGFVVFELPADLPPQDRTLLELRSQGHSHAEIAERLGSTESAIKTRYHRLRLRLRAALGP